MNPPRVVEAAGLLRGLQFIDPTWCGVAHVPCWGGELKVHIYPDKDDFTDRQLAVVRALLVYPHDIRPAFERALFDYYQADVYGTFCSYDAGGNPIPDSGPPRLDEPRQVWSLIAGPDVIIHHYFHTRSAVEFELSFTCDWDPEHGLGVRYRGWKPVEFGGWDL